jgi:hypothetical protein
MELILSAVMPGGNRSITIALVERLDGNCNHNRLERSDVNSRSVKKIQKKNQSLCNADNMNEIRKNVKPVTAEVI